MLTSNIQYKASKKAADDLKRMLEVGASLDLSDKFVEANRNKVRRKLSKIESDISEYEINLKRNITEIPIQSVEDFLLAPIRYRLSKHESVTAFAKVTGINRSQLLRYEDEGYKNCSAPTLIKIFDKLNLSITGQLQKKKLCK